VALRQFFYEIQLWQSFGTKVPFFHNQVILLQVKRGTVFEIAVGHVDIGASVSLVSQYPWEDEYLIPPLACLEVNGPLRVELTDKGQVIMVPIKLNVNLKNRTIETFLEERKTSHISMLKNIREELTIELTKALEDETYKSSNKFLIPKPWAELASRQCIEDLNKLYHTDTLRPAEDFNEDREYQKLREAALQYKQLAKKKFSLAVNTNGDHAQKLSEPPPADSLFARILDLPLENVGQPNEVQGLITGVVGFPWEEMSKGNQTANLTGLKSMDLTVAQEMKIVGSLGGNNNLRNVCILDNYSLHLENGCNTERLKLDDTLSAAAILYAPRTMGLVIGACSRLQSLSMKPASMGVSAWLLFMKGLQHCTSLVMLNGWSDYRNFSLNPADFSDVWDTLKSNKILEALMSLLIVKGCRSLTIRSKDISDTEADLLSQTLSELKCLTSLDLRGCSINQVGWEQIVCVITQSTSLNELNTWNFCPLRDGTIKELKGPLERLGLRLGVFKEMICRSGDCLTKIDLSFNQIGDNKFATLAMGMSQLVNLTLLDLSHNQLSCKSGSVLGKLMEKMQNITSLIIGFNNLGHSGFEALVQGMRATKELKRLDLRGNNLGHLSGSGLAELFSGGMVKLKELLLG